MFDGGIVDGGIGLICEEGNFYNTLYVEDNSITAQCIHQVTGDVSAWSLTDVGGFGVSHSAGGNFSFFNLQDNEARLGGSSNFVLVYNNDYSANYTNRSLVDKEYVDTNIVSNALFTGGTGTNSIKAISDGTNVASSNYSFVVGQSNSATTNTHSSILGGQNNLNEGLQCSIIGGINNQISSGSIRSVIIGGTGIAIDSQDTLHTPYIAATNNIFAEGQIHAGTSIGNTPTANAFVYDCDEGMTQELDLQGSTGTVSLTFSNVKNGATYTLIVIQGSNLDDMSFPTGYWLNDTAPFDFTTLADNDRAMVTATYLNSTWYFAVKSLTLV